MWSPNSWPLFCATMVVASATALVVSFPACLLAGFMVGAIGGTIDELLR